jgi:hypothetical protein
MEGVGRAERLLLLFQGIADLERFSKEIAAAVYRLPWLSPSVHLEEKPIEAEDGIDRLDVQAISNLFDQRPAT